MTTIIAHMTGTGGKLTSVGPAPETWETIRASASRQVPVPKMVLNIAARCGIIPPETGKLTVREVDEKLTAGSVRQEDRITLKRELSRAGIL